MQWEVSICYAYSVLLCWKYALCVKVEEVFRSGIGKPGGVEVCFRSGIGKPSGVEVCFRSGNGKSGGFEIHFYSGDEIIAIFSGTRVGAYCIRPTNGHANGQMNGEMDKISIHFYPMNQKSDWDWIHLAPDVAVCGEYSIRPYTVDLKNGDFSVRLTTGVAVYGAYAIRSYPDGRKFIGGSVRFYPGNQKSD